MIFFRAISKRSNLVKKNFTIYFATKNDNNNNVGLYSHSLWSQYSQDEIRVLFLIYSYALNHNINSMKKKKTT